MEKRRLHQGAEPPRHKATFWVAMWFLWGGPSPSQIIKELSSNADERRYYERYHTDRERIEALKASLTGKAVRP